MLWFKVIGARVLLAAIVAFSVSANAAIVYQNLGVAAPPAVMGGYNMQAFNQAAQAAVVNGTNVATIPGSPVAGNLTTSVNVTKRTVPGGGWASWSHLYAGPVFVTPGNTVVLTLPPGAQAFYFYAEPQAFAIRTITATTNTGETSGPVNVNGNAGATGFGFFATAGETIASITVTTNDLSFAIGEFGIAVAATGATLNSVPTLSQWAIILLASLLVLTAMFRLRGARSR